VRTARRDPGDLAGVAADTRKAIVLWDGRPSRDGEDWFVTACPHDALAGLTGRDGSGVSAGEGITEANAAIALLYKAVDLGYHNSDALRTEGALDPPRGRDDFRLLLMDVAMPADPFAALR
jgi:hypothetical protein